MSDFQNEAYDAGDPKRSDYTPAVVCVFCLGRGGHYSDCIEVA